MNTPPKSSAPRPRRARPHARARQHGRAPSFDALEGRTLLASTAPVLTVTLASHSIPGGSGAGATTGLVSRDGTDNALPLTVSLAVTPATSTASPISVPPKVVIPAGANFTSFGVDAPSGPPLASTQSLTITATATAEAGLGRDPGYAGAAPNFTTTALTTQADGKVVVAGSYYANNSAQMAVLRYNADGSVDTTFNGGVPALASPPGLAATGSAVAVRPSDGEIFVGGLFQAAGTLYRANMVVAHFSPAGRLDGVQTVVPNPTTSYNEARALAVQPDGKILLGGNFQKADSTFGGLGVVRFNADGITLDNTFGTGGYATVSLSDGGDRGYGLALQPDGKIVLAGTSFDGNQTSHFSAVRFGGSGQLDATFGKGGTVSTDVPGDFEQVRGVAIQPDGKIVLASYVDQAGQFPPTANDVALVRYTAAGALDTTFGTAGVVVKDFGGDDRASSVLVEPDGMIVVGASTNGSTSTVARFLPTGAFDASSDGNGAGIQAIAQQPSGRVVAVSTNPYATNVGTVDAFTGIAAITGSDALTVTAGYQVPVAVDDNYTATKATALTVAGPGLLANDTVAPGYHLSAYRYSSPAHGSLTLKPNGSFTYTPTGNYLGTDSFVYYNSDGTKVSNLATVHLTVAGTNDPPIAAADSYTVQNYATTSGSLVVGSPGVLANDSDPNGQPITASLASGPANGTLDLKPDGSFSYRPQANFLGTDSFIYRASDGALLSDYTRVTIAVRPAVGSIRVTLWDDGDGDGKIGTAEGFLPGRTVYLDQNRDGLLDNGELSTTTDANGSYAFLGLPLGTYYVAQVLPAGYAQTAPADAADRTVNLADGSPTVLDFNELAGASDQTVGTYRRNGYTIDTSTTQPTKFRVFGSSDAAAYAGSPALSSQWAPTVITLTRDDGMPFTLNSMNLSTTWSSVYDVTVSFTGTRVDGSTVGQSFAIGSQLGFHPATFVGFTNLKSVSWSSTNVNDYHQFDDVSVSASSAAVDATGVNFGARGMTAVADSFATLENQPLVVAAPGVLGNDFSSTGKPLRAYLSSPVDPEEGTIALNQDGSFTYTPAADFYGTAAFQYYVSDGTYSSDPVVSLISVAHVDQAPVAVDDAYNVDQGGTLTAGAGETSLHLVSQPGEYIGKGLSYDFTSANSSFDVIPLTDTDPDNGILISFDSGTDIFDFRFAAPANTRLAPGTYTGARQAGSGSSTAPELDAWGDFRSYKTSIGQFTVTQAEYDAAGTILQFAATFSLSGDGSTATLSGSVMYRATPGQPGGVLINDNDVEYDPLTARLVAAPTHGTLGLNPDGSFRYVPDPGFWGVDQFTYVANDGQLDGNVATARVTVNPVYGVRDPGFESAAVGPGGYAYNPAGSPWTFSPNTGDSGSGLTGNGSPFTGGNPDAPQGAQVAFLQSHGTISQAVNFAQGGTYRVAFRAAQRGNYGTSIEDFQVLVDGAVVGTFLPTGTSYRTYATSTFAVAAGMHAITFRGLDTGGIYDTAFLDDVAIIAADPAPADSLGDSGFESVPVGSGGPAYAYDPAGSAWAFAGDAGLSGNGSGFTAGNPAAPEGAQVAFLQDGGSVSQSVSLAAGTYKLTFLAAQRQNFASSQAVQVLVDGVVVGTIAPAGTTYARYASDAFTVSDGVHTITLRGTSGSIYDTAFVDDITLTATPPGQAAAAMTGLMPADGPVAPAAVDELLAGPQADAVPWYLGDRQGPARPRPVDPGAGLGRVAVLTSRARPALSRIPSPAAPSGATRP